VDVGPSAPPVVAVVVTRDPGVWFDDVLGAVAAQDYPNLRLLVVDISGQRGLEQRVAAYLPDAYFRQAAAQRTFGGAANESLRLVEGSGFFLFLQEDVALEPSAVRLLVEETYRSNAGIVGPKVLEWDDPDRLISVGVSVDKFGETNPAVEPGELDQEQHDGVRDTFALSSACLLVRTDLFRAIGGFDPVVAGTGVELDLCWRAHASGARVLVVPSARVRWRGEVTAADERTRERQRLRTMLASYSRWHLLRVLPQYVVVTMVEVVARVLTGRFRRAGALLAAGPGALGDLRAIRRKRRIMIGFRQVGDDEVRRLQSRGSARLAAFFRGHSRREDGGSALARAGRDLVDMFRTGHNRASYLAWVAVVAVFLVGSRTLITDRVPALGGFLAFPHHATTLLGDYLSGWWAHGLGGTGAVPSGVALLGVGGIGFLGAMSLFRTVAILGPILLGLLGAWRLVRPLGTQRARLTGLLVYGAVALPYNAVAAGRWSALLVYGAMPWVFAMLARITALAPYGPVGADPSDAPDPATATTRAMIERRPRPLVARIAGLGILVAVVSAFVPVFAVEVVLVAVAMAVGAVVTGGLAGALRALGAAAGAAVVAVLLHLPWTGYVLGHLPATLGAAPLASPANRGLDALLRFATGAHDAGVIGYLLLVPAVVALLVGRSWRLAWAGRAVTVALAFFALAWAGDRGWGPAAAVPVEVWLVPAAVGVALAGACGATAVDRDVRGTRLSWRQPLGFLAVVAVAVGVLPAIGAAADGSWGLGRTDFADALSFLPSQQTPGDYRILWVGDPRAVPLPGWRLADGVSYALSQNGAPDIRDTWAGDPSRSEQLVAQALHLATTGESSRLGRMLGPMAVRYIIVPKAAGPQASGAPSYPPPSALLNTLAGQLDLRQVDIDDALVVYENEAWIPVRATLTAPAARASDEAGFEALVRTDISGATAVLPDDNGANAWAGDVGPGTLYLSAAADSGWGLTVDGRSVPRRPAFGWANAFAVTAGGHAHLAFDTPLTRPLAVLVQIALWLLAIGLACYRGPREREEGRWRHPAARRAADPPAIIDLSEGDLTARSGGPP
jgi:GT2 family glycosyltransferase